MNKTFYIFSLGCKVNSYECSALASLLMSLGYKEDEKNPDVVVVNTCSVTKTADQKSRQHIRKFQKMFPDAAIIVMGCYAQGNKEYISREIKPSILIGTSNRNKIPELLERYFKEHTEIVEVDDKPRFFDYEDFGITSYSENTRAYLKIQDGCDNFCAYCIVPFRRGRSRSRRFESIIEEAKHLIKNGYQEIVLTGIHVGGYGKDLEGVNFSSLVEALLDLEGLNSLRISSLEESEIDDKLIDLIKIRKNLAKHLHIPLQSGSTEVLERMGRKHNADEFFKKIQKIKESCPDIMLSTDVIVGFPGESDRNFKETYDFINKCGFNMLHVFPFSPREGTKAARMTNQIDGAIKKERSNILLELSKKNWDEYVSKFIGKDVEVLIEKYESGKNIGHTSNYIEVEIPSTISKVGERIVVKLEKSAIVSK